MTTPFTADSPLAGILGGLVAPATPATMAPAVPTSSRVLDYGRLAVALMGHQTEAVEYIADKRRVYLGDEMGLGKTYVALAVLALTGALPAVIICPPSLTLNWAKEARKLAPWLRVAVLSGMTPSLPEVADVYIVGDAVLAKWAGLHTVKYQKRDGSEGKRDAVDGALTMVHAAALVVDEAHRFKSYKAQRARAAMAFAATLPEGAIRLLMSGTAVVNRTAELATQIRIAGVDHVFGGWYRFLETYAPTIDRFGTRGNAHTMELHRIMVDSFYLRRLRSEVLTLPGKGRQMVATPMAGKAAAEYKLAEDDLIAYIRGERGAAAAEKAGKAEALVLLNTLRRLAGAAKVAAIINYVRDLVDDGEQVFIAAWHAPTVAAYMKAFADVGAVAIKGGQDVTVKDASVRAFMAGDARVLVGNIVAAGVGFTLTAARHIVIAELPWTPGDLQQVEDRLDRIGQTREVVSHVCLASNGEPTVDERLMGILNDKAAVTGVIHDGIAATIIDDDSIAAALLDSYRDAA